MEKDKKRCANCGAEMKQEMQGNFRCPECGRRENKRGKIVTPGTGQDAGW